MSTDAESLAADLSSLAGSTSTRPLRELLERGFDKACVMASGEQLFEEDPDALDIFSETAQKVTAGDNRDGRYRCIGTGTVAVVYELPGRDDLCVKVVSPRTMKAAYKLGVENARPPSLFVDLRFMDRIHRRLKRAAGQEQGVFVPKHHAAVRMRDSTTAYAMLEERLPRDVISIGQYFDSEEIDYETTKQIADALKVRFDRALGCSALKLGINDFMVGATGEDAHVINCRNTWVDPNLPIDETPLHIIDLVRGSGFRRPAARLLGRLAI